MTFKFHPDNTLAAGDWIFAFGSNEAGKHGKGAERMDNCHHEMLHSA